MIDRAKANSAFTLMEMLVALTLIGILATALYSSLHIGFNARSRAEAAIAPVRTAALALELLYNDVASAVPPAGILAGAFIAVDETGEGSVEDADTLELCAIAGDGDRGAPGIRKIEFLLTSSEDDAETVLVRRVTANLLAPVTPEPDEDVLCRNVTSFNLRHFDGAAWLDSWDSTMQANALPVAVEVHIEVNDPGVAQVEGETHQLTRVFRLPCGAMPGSEGRTQEASQT